MKTKNAQILGILALLALVNSARASSGAISTLFDTITGTNAISATMNFAQAFTTGTTNYLVYGATLDMATAAGSTSGLTLTLNANNGGSPGAVLATFTDPGTLIAGNNNFTTNANLFLNPNTTYWLEVDPPSPFNIRTTTSTSASGLPGWTLGGDEEDLNSGGWTSDPNNLVFSIQALAAAPTPEPATLAVGALGAGALLRFRRRK